MKKIIAFLCVSLFAAGTFAQDKFTVPTPTDFQKYQTAAWQWNGAYITLISYAKSLGKSVEDTGSSIGEIIKVTWNKENGFDGFANGMLYVYVTFAPNGTVEITEQKENKIQFIVKNFYPPLKQSLEVFKVTYEEYLKFFDFTISKLAEYMGSTYTQKDTDGNLIVTIEKK
jgi:hypothetical protein